MARVTIEIDTHDADGRDEAILAAVSGGKTRVALTPAETQAVDYVLDAVGARTEEPATDAPKRTRRTKAQIEAEAAAQATQADGSTESAASGQPATEAAPPAETASTPAGATDDGEATLQMVNDRIKHLMAKGVGAPALVAICKQHGGGAASAKMADPKFLPAIWDALGELMS